MPLYIHTCISEVSGIAMMINCIVSVLYGRGRRGKKTHRTGQSERGVWLASRPSVSV